ncbi:DUF4097 family beta strand repeat-containing protein [Cytobacillus sp. FJAT-54145]|uniref:DUF4097 family beta strand repeat-containing protein n=1 Tax=Cytobacillus spartinae TaxID=3299023 RepID=A0ABW6KEC5_9BACI
MNEEKKRILKMVEEGKLTVDEALVLLEELEKSSKTMKQKEEEIIGELSTVVNFDDTKKEDYSNSQKFQSVKDKLFDFVDSALKKIKDLDLDLNFAQSVEISHVFQQADVYLKDMDVDIANGSVKIIPWDQNDVRVECEAKVHRVETQDEARSSFLKDVTFAVEGQKLRFIVQQKWMKVNAVIYVPQSTYETVRIRLFNGAISSENLNINKYRVKTANGKISLKKITSKSVEAETANGHIEVRSGKIDDFEAETINGAIKVDGSFKKLDVQTFHGSIVCSVEDPYCERIEAKATTGNVKLYVPESAAISGQLKSNLGGFDLDLSGVQVTDEKNDVVQKFVRFHSVKPSELVTKLDAETKTGSIAIKQVK